MNIEKNIEITVIVLLDKWYTDSGEHLETLFNIFIETNRSFEIVVICLGTTYELLNDNIARKPFFSKLKIISMNSKTPQSISAKAALKESKGAVILTSGAYQQISAESYIKLLNHLDEETDMISPHRQNRVDPSINQFQSWLFNQIVKKVTHSSLNDLSCTVRVFKRYVLENIDLYGNMFRFMPVVAAKRGFTVKEVKCEHFKEYGKTGLYRISEYINRIIDILSLFFIMGYTKKPLRFFSSIGAFLFSIGSLTGAVVILQKLLWGVPLGDRKLLLVSIIFASLGIQAFSVGLLGEIVAFANGRNKKEYIINKLLGFNNENESKAGD